MASDTLNAAVGPDDGRHARQIQEVLSAKDLNPRTVRFFRYMRVPFNLGLRRDSAENPTGGRNLFTAHY
jgi:hypothetical protein